MPVESATTNKRRIRTPSPPNATAVSSARAAWHLDSSGRTDRPRRSSVGHHRLRRLEGNQKPRLVAADHPGKAASPQAAETTLLTLIDDAGPDVVAIDAPLTLPPCLTCPSSPALRSALATF